ncbi:hypothetical protein [Halohasta litorea]|uniref:DUF8130 domain-containing protein n=1 Tax=Halohasta litorea TaxID=869891 RepID=A0ABD6DCD9_9EURY|nr:hypothetical protein [Halohasta litorea]
MKRRHYLGVTTATLGGLAGCLGDPEYSIESVSPTETAGALAFEVAAVDTAITVDSPGSLDLTLRNDGEEAVELRTPGVWPFGMVALVPTDGSEFRTLLLTDGYAETDRIEVTANSAHQDNTPIVRALAASESVTERYVVDGKRLQGDGTYVLDGYFEDGLCSYRTGDSEWSEFRSRVSVTVSERALLP